VRAVLLVPVFFLLLLGPAGAVSPAAAQGQGQEPPPSQARPAPARAPSPLTANPFLGGVPTGTATSAALSLSILDAINRALEHNLGVLMAEEGIGRARGTRWRALSGLLPTVNGRVSLTRQQINLSAFGFPLPAGFPAIVGPFNVFDARVYVTQPVLDLHALNDARAEAHNIAAAQFSYKSARDLVVLVAANAYLQALAASSRADSARAQVQTAEALHNQAVNLRQNGIVAGIEVLRAEVQLNTERQRATATQNDFEKAKLQLAHIIGLPLGQSVSLIDELPDVPVPDMRLEQALERAYQTRPDYQAAAERVRAAEAARAAIVGEALPSVRVDANYGDLGLSLPDSHSTFSIVGAVNVPIFQGGRTRGRLLEADADLRDRRAQLEDLKATIYYDVRTAFLDLQASGEQLQVATGGRQLAATQLTQARDRFAAGVASNIEVVQAQEAVALANEEYISALYLYNVGKAVLARGLGVAEDFVRQYLGGVR
jgi:outer membrane protein TolC